MLGLAEKYKDNVNVEAIRPTVEWRSTESDLATSLSGHPHHADAPSA
jgi:hypothetical protein